MGRLTAASLRRIVGRSGYEMIDTFVETGTANGELTEIVAVEFDRVHAIELDPVHVAMTKQRLVERVERVGKCEHVTVYTGDSREVLPRVIEQLPKAAFFFLDAHYCRLDPPIAKSEFPLWVELELVKARGLADIVAVDDMHTFGKKRDELRYEPGKPEWEGVTGKSLLRFFGKRVVAHDAIDDAFVMWLGWV